jgi:alkaline phosphatase D
MSNLSPEEAARLLVRELAERQALVSRRALIRGAVLLAIGLGSGAGLVGCGGGGGDDDDDHPGESIVDDAIHADGPFLHGVASGDPLQDRVILWTRVSVAAPGVLFVSWEVALDQNFGFPIARGQASTGPDQDYTVKVDVTGLQPGTTYFYRFIHGRERSNIGRTRTLPTDDVGQVRFAVFSCSNFPAGYFNVYAHAARRDDIDCTLHLGDYIYEYGLEGFASQLAIAIDRESDPPREILTLADYRRRHAQYKTDPDLRSVHAMHPMIAVWDDHDLADNAWKAGAANHDPATEGSFEARRAAAVQAYHEWLPTRLPDPANPLRIFRSFHFGTLASVHCLDTRIIGRDEQQTLQQFLDGQTQSPDRQLLGVEQSAWLTGQLTSSRATWQVLAQQVLMARMEIPLSVALALDLETLTEFLVAQATPESARTDEQQALVTQPRVPYNMDAWDGYPAARESVLATAKALNRDLVSLAGDTHNAWASDLTDANGAPVGVEFATSSVSSPGFERALPLLSATILEDAFLKMVRDLRYAETSKRGYLVLTLSRQEARADWVQVSSVFTREYSATVAKSLKTTPGQRRIV